MTRSAQFTYAIRKTFSRPSGYVAAALGALFVILLTVALPNASLLRFTFAESAFPPALKLKTAAAVLWNGRLIFAVHGGWIALAIAAAFGVNTALVFHYMRERVRIDHAAGAGLAGTLVGLLGIGCAACGSVVLTSLLGLGAVAALPFHGKEFAWLGLGVIVASTVMISRKIAEPEACRIPDRK